MSQKINLQELSSLLSERSGSTKKDAEIFLKEYFDILTNAIIEDKLLKVKGIGTFKLTLVNDRASVDVATGNRVLIPAHYKISYTPDTQLAETINEPFALFESVEIPLEDEEIKDSETQDSIIDDIPVEITEEVIEASKPSKEKSSEEEIEINHKVVEEVIIDQKEGSELKDSNLNEKVFFSPIDEKEKKRPINWLAIISILLLLIMGAIVFFVYYEESSYSTKTANMNIRISQEDNKKEVITYDRPIVSEAEETTVTEKQELLSTETEIEKNTLNKETDNSLPKKEITNIQPQIEPNVPTSSSNTRILRHGETLRIIAEQELGDREFWVYIYLKNKDKIKNPNKVPIGISLLIPNKSEYGGIDALNENSIERAKAKSMELAL